MLLRHVSGQVIHATVHFDAGLARVIKLEKPLVKGGCVARATHTDRIVVVPAIDVRQVADAW